MNDGQKYRTADLREIGASHGPFMEELNNNGAVFLLGVRSVMVDIQVESRYIAVIILEIQDIFEKQETVAVYKKAAERDQR